MRLMPPELDAVCRSRRLMNHSCEPTLQAQEVNQLRGYFRILFMATRHIYPGDELTIDYGARACVRTASRQRARQRRSLGSGPMLRVRG